MQPRKILPPTYWMLSIVVMVGLHFLIPIARVITFPWNLLGLVPVAIGVIINIIASNRFDRLNTTIKPYEESAVLVTEGLFQLSRNPMYLGGALILAGIAMILGSVSPYLVIVVFVYLMNEIFIKIEEEMLAQKFGSSYLAYKERVRRWI